MARCDMIPVVFTSWKEIASYLGKGVRTVQRWEAEFGLPVQRPNSHAKGIVRATKEDLDQWIATRWSPRSGKLELPDGAVEIGRAVVAPTNAGIKEMEELRMQNRTLLMGLQQSLEQLAKTCQNLTGNLQRSHELAQSCCSQDIAKRELEPSSPAARTQATAN